MTISEFVNKWNGKFLDADGTYGPQCVDVPKQWIAENGWPPKRGNAIDWRNNGDDFYRWTNNSATAVPSPGDIIVFQTGTYGHIGVVVSANSNTVDVFNQNWPHGNCTDPCQVTRFNYVSPKVIGWLHPVALDIVSPPPAPPEDPNLAKIRDLESQILSLQQTVNIKDIQISDLVAQLEFSKIDYKALTQELASCKITVEDTETQVDKLLEINSDLTKKVEECKNKPNVDPGAPQSLWDWIKSLFNK